MATKKISELTNTATANDVDLMVLDQWWETKNITAKDFIESISPVWTEGSRVSVWISSNQTVTDTATILEFDTEFYDTLNEFNTWTYTFTAANTWYYQIGARIEGSVNATWTIWLEIHKNWTSIAKYISAYDTSNSFNSNQVNTTLLLTAWDTIKAVINADTWAWFTVLTGQQYTNLTIDKI